MSASNCLRLVSRAAMIRSEADAEDGSGALATGEGFSSISRSMLRDSRRQPSSGCKSVYTRSIIHFVQVSSARHSSPNAACLQSLIGRQNSRCIVPSLFDAETWNRKARPWQASRLRIDSQPLRIIHAHLCFKLAARGRRVPASRTLQEPFHLETRRIRILFHLFAWTICERHGP